MKDKQNKVFENKNKLREFIVNDPERKLRINMRRTESMVRGLDGLRGLRINLVKQLQIRNG